MKRGMYVSHRQTAGRNPLMGPSLLLRRRWYGSYSYEGAGKVARMGTSARMRDFCHRRA